MNNNEPSIVPSTESTEVPSVVDSSQSVLEEILAALTKEETVAPMLPEITIEELEEIQSTVNQAMLQADESIKTGKTIGAVGAALGVMNLLMYAYQRLMAQVAGSRNNGERGNRKDAQQMSEHNTSESNKASPTKTAEKPTEQSTQQKEEKPNKANEKGKSTGGEKKEQAQHQQQQKEEKKQVSAKMQSEAVAKLGYVTMEKYNIELLLLNSADSKQLHNGGLGLYAYSALPAKGEQIIMLGYINNNAEQLIKAKIDDVITITMPYGDFQYHIVRLEKCQLSKPIIANAIGKEQLVIILTDAFVKYNRYIIYAELLTIPTDL